MRDQRGRNLTKNDLVRIIELLKNPELSISAIAARFGRPVNTIAKLNRRLGIRKILRGL